MQFYPRAFVGIAAILFLSCIFEEEKKFHDPFRFRNQYAIAVIQPNLSAPFDSLFYLQILWRTLDSTLSKKVNVVLFSDLGETVLVKDIPDTGSVFVNLMDYEIPRKDWFRIKIYDALDTSQYDYSRAFPITVSPKYRVYFKDFPPAGGLRLDTTYEIKLDLPSLTTNSFTPAQPYYGWFVRQENRVEFGPIPETDSLLYLYVPNKVGSGTNIRVCISKNAYPYMGGCSAPFSIESTYHGRFVFEDILPTDTFEAGSLTTTLIRKDGNPGNPGLVGLYWDSLLVQKLADSIADGGKDTVTLHWQPSARLMTSSRYRIGIVNQSDPSLGISFSEAFTIRGVLADTFEFNDTKEYARPILVNAPPQRHTQPFGDEDWAWFYGEAGNRYHLILTSGFTRFEIDPDTTFTLELDQISPSMRVIEVRKSQKIYLQTLALNSQNSGEYWLYLTEVGEGVMGIGKHWLMPSSGQNVMSGTEFNLTWQTDSLFLGDRIKLELFLDSNKVQTLTNDAPNTGQYSWSVDTGLQTSSQYQLRITSVTTPDIWGDGPKFSIQGQAPDAYEPDNRYEMPSKILVNAPPQVRGLAIGDVDWVEFECANDESKYEVQIESQFPVSLGVRAKPSHFTGGLSPMITNITGTGRCLIEVYAHGPTYGSYRLTVTGMKPVAAPPL